jgi:hypothetical protein
MRAMFVAFAFAVSFGQVWAQTICSGPATPGFIGSGFLGVSPVAPTSDQPVAITVGRIAHHPTAISAQIQGTAVNVTLNGTFTAIGVPPPTTCLTVTVGPLAPGSYVVNAHLLPNTAPGAPPSSPTLIAMTPLQVTPGSSAIPLLSPATLLAFAVLLALAARHVLRRSNR